MRMFNFLPRVLVVFAVLSLIGCDSRTPKVSGGESEPAEVRLGYFANLTHAQAVLGVHSGDFERAVAPAKLTTRVFNAGPSLIEALFAGEIDIGYVGPSPALNAHQRSKGEGIRVIAGAAANGVIIVARKDAGISSVADLRGKKIATPQLGNTQDVSAKHYLSRVLGQKDLSTILPIANAEQSALMQRGQIDAAWAPEPWGSRLIVEAGAVQIGDEKDLWPDKQFSLTLVVTTPKFLATHPKTVEKLLAAHRAWTVRLQADPQAQLKPLDEALFKLNGKRLPTGVVPMAIKNVKFTDEPLAETLATFAQWADELGLTRGKSDLAGLIDTTILRKLQADPARGPK